ncbi:MAG: D-alanine--D-alanine ligase family protein [Anaerolineales bacterium]|nr:D-alanine--D-alanine ligase family protein [Anaerolineales bacterium]
MSAVGTVGVIFGGRSGEHEVSLMSAGSVIDALGEAGYKCVEIGIDLDGHWYSGDEALDAFQTGQLEQLDRVALLAEPGSDSLFSWGLGEALASLAELDVVFPVLHGTFGEDGTLQGLLELADVAYVGAGVLASSVAMDKGLFKHLMMAHELPILPFEVLQSGDIEQDPESAAAAAERVGDYPLFAKPANLGSSVGVTKCTSRSDLMEGLLEAARYDRRVVVERGIDAREIEISVLGNERPQASVAGEIRPSRDFYTYEAKYVDDASELLIPAPISDELMAEVERIALQAYQAIDGAGMGRVDFLLEKETDSLYLNEINTIPGFTRISMYPKLWAASGVEYPELCDRLIQLALARQEQKSELVRRYGGQL